MSEKLLSKRKLNRLRGYDYSKNNAYFITICSINRLKIFSVIAESETAVGDQKITGDQWSPLHRQPQLTTIGKIINEKINLIPQIYNGVFVEHSVIMPNHVHLIIFIENVVVGATVGRPLPTGHPSQIPTISKIIQQWKGAITKQVGHSIWQKSFHDHIIRNEIEYIKTAEYIMNNPINWETDDLFSL